MKSDKYIKLPLGTSKISQYAIILIAIGFVVLICRPLANQQSYHIVSFILLFVVTVMAAFLGIGPILLASTISALVWNYFFLPPHFTFHIAKTEDKFMFGSFFLVALLNGVLTNRIRRQEKLAREGEERTNAMFELTKDLSNTNGIKEILEVAYKAIRKYFEADSIFVFKENADGIEILNRSEYEDNLLKVDLNLAAWVFKNSAKAGKFTEVYNNAELTYYPIAGSI